MYDDVLHEEVLNMETTTLTIRIDKQVKKKLDTLAKFMSRSKAYLANVAIQDYLSNNAWLIEETTKAIKKADSPKAKFVDDAEVIDWLDSWGTDKEKEPPLCR